MLHRKSSGGKDDVERKPAAAAAPQGVKTTTSLRHPPDATKFNASGNARSCEEKTDAPGKEEVSGKSTTGARRGAYRKTTKET
ncbi:hypothetical protein KEM56_007585 [Ascosphaera pollenicola]|nr:hypothetical protein KEM56_007585 [Ascosphaera pollenicola]